MSAFLDLCSLCWLLLLPPLFPGEVQCAICSSTNTRSARGLFAPCRVQSSNPAIQPTGQRIKPRGIHHSFYRGYRYPQLVIAHQVPIHTCLSQSVSLSQQIDAISTSCLADNELNKPQEADTPKQQLEDLSQIFSFYPSVCCGFAVDLS